MHSSPLPLSARRYAGALYDLAAQSSLAEQTGAALQSLAAVLHASEDFRRFIASPLYNAGAQARFIRAFNQAAGLAGKSAAEGKAGAAAALLGRFLTVLARHKRLGLLPQVIAAYAARAAQARGDAALEVITPQELTKAQEKSLLAALDRLAASHAGLSKKYSAAGNKILHKRVDPALLGGVIVRCGSLLIDASLRSKLSSLKLALKEVG